MIKINYKNSTANVIFNDEIIKAAVLKTGNEKRTTILILLLFNIIPIIGIPFVNISLTSLYM